jgi:L-iditol 2-dehydrogenase
MGLCTLAALKGRAAASLIAVDLLQERLVMAQEMGATHVLKGDDPDLLKKIDAISGGRGTDVVFEVTGTSSAAETAAKTMRKGRARYVLAGWYGKPEQYTLRNWTMKGAVLLAAHPNFSLDPFDDMRRGLDGLQRGVFPMEKLVTHSFSLEQLQNGFETMVASAPGYIKGVVTP